MFLSSLIRLYVATNLCDPSDGGVKRLKSGASLSSPMPGEQDHQPFPATRLSPWRHVIRE
jgi:hypothetical protein